MTNQPGKPTCEFCGGSINPQFDYRKVTGYERRRDGGGTNALRLREQHDTWGCTTCVDRAAKKINPLQSALI